MGHHIDKEGRFQSDKNPDLAPDKIVLSFFDPAARVALWAFADATEDRQLAADVYHRLTTSSEEMKRRAAARDAAQRDAEEAGAIAAATLGREEPEIGE